MTRRDFSRLLTLAAMTLVAGPALAFEAVPPGAPEFDYQAEATGGGTAPTDEPLARGRVVAVDPSTSRVTLEFQPIPPYLPEGGTRIFQVENAKWLKGLGPGDKVRFDVEREGRGFTVIRLENSN